MRLCRALALVVMMAGTTCCMVPGDCAVAITRAVLCKDYVKGAAQDVTTTFSPADHKVHVVITFPKIIKVQLRFVWMAVQAKDTQGQVFKNIKIMEKTVPSQLMDHAHGSVELPSDWPIGAYKVDIFVDNQLVKTLPFIVK